MPVKLSAAVLGVIAAVVLAPAAHADADQFHRDMEAEGFSHDDGDEGLLRFGNTLCAHMDQGWPIEDIVANDLMTMVQLNAYQKSRFFDLAVMDLCPQNTERLHTWLNGG